MRGLALLLAALALPACEEDVNDDSTSPAVTRRVSVGAGGQEADRACEAPDLTPDGRYAVFQTAAALVPEDNNGKIDIYRKDLATHAIILVSVNDFGEPGDGDSTAPSISADGGRVAFESLAMNLATGGTDPDTTPDVYVRDLGTGTTTHVSQAPTPGPFGSFSPAISGDGAFVVFVSDALDLVADPENVDGSAVVFRTELSSGMTEIVSLTPGGEIDFADSDFPSVSFDGRLVAFESTSDDLVPGDTSVADIFVRDMTGTDFERIGGNGPSSRARMTPDGRRVVFVSSASNLVSGDLNGLPDVFLHDRQAPATTVKISESFLGTGASGDSSSPVVSADGRFVAFLSTAPNLVPGDGNAQDDHFLRDVLRGVTYRLSVRTGGAQTGQASIGRPALSGDGRWALFASRGSDLVVGDANGETDVFLRGPNY